MPISFDSALGIHDKALNVRARRAEMLASNIANAETPGYKAKDIDFRAALSQAAEAQASKLKTTHTNHISTGTSGVAVETMYRIPNQPALDGNTVDAQLEKSAFADNALRYQASLNFVDSKLRGLLRAFKGE